MRPSSLPTLVALSSILALGAAASCGGTNGAAPGSGSSSGNASSSSGGSSGASAPSGLPCDVEKVLAANCASCHSDPPAYGAPMSIMSHDAMVAPAPSDPSKKVYELVGTRIHDDAKPMPQAPNPRLSAADTATLDAYVAAGAPLSTDTCTGSSGDGGVTPLDCTPDTSLKAASPWTMPQADGNDYVCYGFDVTKPIDRHVVGITPRIDNTKIVHHILLFQADSSYSTTPQKCSAGGGADWRVVYAWAPGGKAMILPKEAGFPIHANEPAHYVVQIHYNNVQGLSGQTDTSGVDLCTDAPRANEADVVAFGTLSINIPAQGTLDKTCTAIPQVMSALTGKKLFAAMPHMHTLGTAIDTKLYRNGTTIDLGTVPSWNFQNQYWFPVDATVAAGDQIKTHCAWNNPTSQTVKFGENTENEMCFSFTMYYPRVTASVWNWEVAAATSTCN